MYIVKMHAAFVATVCDVEIEKRLADEISKVAPKNH
jgi:hypothetical protein